MKNSLHSRARILSKNTLSRPLGRAILTLAAGFALAGLGRAAVVTTLSASAPTGADILASQTVGNSGLSWFNSSSSSLRNVGQSFLATSSFTMDKITLMLGGSFNSTAATTSFTFTLFSASSLATSPASATLVSTQTGSFAFTSGSGGDGTFLTFDVSDISLTAGTYYTFMLALNDASANTSLTVKQNTASTYADGVRWLYDGTSYSSSAASDLTFYVQAAVPEPGTVALVTASLCFLLLVRRRVKA